MRKTPLTKKNNICLSDYHLLMLGSITIIYTPLKILSESVFFIYLKINYMQKKNFLNSVKMATPKKSLHDLSHLHDLSCNPGELVPVSVIDVVPGDKVKVGTHALIRTAPLATPAFTRFKATFHTFFIPYRPYWANSEKFFTNNDGQSLPAVPYLTLTGDPGDYTKLDDHLGIPNPATIDSPHEMKIQAFAHMAYQACYNEYYRDENLITTATGANLVTELLDGDNGAQAGALRTLRHVAWRPDQFNKSLPFAQKGPAVGLPIGPFDDVPVKLQPTSVYGTGSLNIPTTGVPIIPINIENSQGVTGNNLYAETSVLDAVVSTINDLRRTIKIQEWLEKTARAGSRYFEMILGHFGVKSPDMRLQRPEYIGGAKDDIMIGEVLSTVETDTAPQGTMTGKGIGKIDSGRDFYFVQEHGIIMTMMFITPEPAYYQGLNKMFTKLSDPMQWLWPSFVNLGEQPLTNEEVYAYLTPGTADDEAQGTFGYLPAYYEYRIQPNRISGDFRTTLLNWTLARSFSSKPSLNQQFIECTPDECMRIFAITDPDVDHFYCNIANMCYAVRPLPFYGTPSF